MRKFPSHLVTPRIKKEILADAAILVAKTLQDHASPVDAGRSQPKGLMLEIRFNPKREPGDWLRVAFVDRHEADLEKNRYRIGYDAACDGFPVTKDVLVYSISSRTFPPFEAMIRSGLRRKEVEAWVMGVAVIAEASHHIDSILSDKHLPSQESMGSFSSLH